MSNTDNAEKKFVIKNVFKDAKNLVIDGGDGTEISGPVEEHFGVKWKLRLYKYDVAIYLHLDCLHNQDSCDWSIETEFTVLFEGKDPYGIMKHTFTKNKPSDWSIVIISDYDEFFTSDDMSIEFHVTIKKMTGIEEKKKKLRHFDEDDAKELSDVVLVVGGEKFYVLKKFLASHSTYFKTLFLGNFSESQNSKIELKDIDPELFQDFLELIHGVSLVKEYTVSGILKLADYFDAPIALQRCEEFLMKNSENSVAEKFEMSIKYKMKNLKSKCLEEM